MALIYDSFISVLSLLQARLKMSLKFCANLSFMFQEYPTLLARYNKAREAGFRGVECAFPYDLDLDELVAVKENAEVEQVLINAPPGKFYDVTFASTCMPPCVGHFQSLAA